MKITNLNDEILKIKRKDFEKLQEEADCQIDLAAILVNQMPEGTDIKIQDLLQALVDSKLKLTPEAKNERNLVRIAYFMFIGCVYKMRNTDAS